MSTPLLVIAWAAVALALLLSVRMARSAWRAQSVAELLMALFFFGGGVLGYGSLLLRLAVADSMEAAAPLLYVSELGFLVPPVTVTLFTWLVFRHKAAWARNFALALSLSTLVLYACRWWIGSASAPDVATETGIGAALFWLGAAVRGVSFGWAGAEAWAFRGKALKQVGLGLLDPLVANRFLLWSIWSATATGMLVLRVATPFLTDYSVEPPESPTWLVVAQLVTGLSCALAVWLTFAPPGFYSRMIRGSAAER